MFLLTSLISYEFSCVSAGVWFMHCHLEVHTSWGLKMAWVVLDGKLPNQKLLPPPADLPRCWRASFFLTTQRAETSQMLFFFSLDSFLLFCMQPSFVPRLIFSFFPMSIYLQRSLITHVGIEEKKQMYNFFPQPICKKTFCYYLHLFSILS